MKCPTCKGTKQITTTVTFHGSPDVETMQLDCVVCDGTGKVTRAMAKAIAAHNADWCRCKAPDPNAVQYYPDGAHPNCAKHHYRHEPGCGGILQIG